MPDPSPTGFSSKKRRLSRKIALAVCVTLCVSALTIFFGVGRWLLVEDPLQQAQAVVVLSGAMPVRAMGAARLYRDGYAPQVWLTRGREPTASLQKMHIAYIGEDFFDTQVLMHEGVPANAVRTLEPAVENTADEMKVIAEELVRQNGSKVIIVTSKAHTRRVRTLWSKLSRQSGQAIVRAAPDDPFEPAAWWRTTRDSLDVMREVFGLLNAWAGLPLRPSN